MSDGRPPTPWTLRVVGGVALLWSGLGCFDYVMTQTRGDAWLAQMEPTELQLAWFHGLPAWYQGSWAGGVWAGLLGAVLLLFRRRWAFHAFAASLVAWAAGAIYTFGLSNGAEAMGPWWPMLVFKGSISAFFLWYAGMMSKKGVLR